MVSFGQMQASFCYIILIAISDSLCYLTVSPVCCRCWIGKCKLDTACEQVKDIFIFKIRWKPYLLSPHTPEEGVPYIDFIRYKYGEEAAKAAFGETSPLYEATSAVVCLCVVVHNLLHNTWSILSMPKLKWWNVSNCIYYSTWLPMHICDATSLNSTT